MMSSDNRKKRSFTTPRIVTSQSVLNYEHALLGTNNLQCPIQMKILSNNVNNYQTSHRNKQQKLDVASTPMNVSDLSYQTPTPEKSKYPFSPIDTSAQYSSPIKIFPTTSSSGSNPTGYSPFTPNHPERTPTTHPESGITTPLNIQQGFASPTMSCGDISPIFFDFRKVSTTPPPNTLSLPGLKGDDSDNKIFGKMPYCQEIVGTPENFPSSYFPLPYECGNENAYPIHPDPQKISPDYVRSQPCPPASSSRRYRRKCEVPSCPNRK